VINYFGQGAYLLTPGSNPGDNLFYSLVPQVALIPMIILATIATIIASQALISGSFSLIQQAIALGTFPLERIDLMLCLDLVGHACGGDELPPEVRGSLFVLGAELSRGTPALVDRVAARARGVWPRRLHADVIPPLSDYHPFHEAQVPFLFLTCGRWQHYHQPTDTPERLAWEKMTATTAFLIDLTLEASRRPEPRVEWLADGRDDAASLRTLRELASLVLPTHTSLEPVLARLDALSKRREPLSSEERLQISALIGRMESLLG
jgi:hypothetical protein